MSDDIRAGDVVQCVDVATIECLNGLCRHYARSLRFGGMYRVSSVGVSVDYNGRPMRCGCRHLVMADGTVGIPRRFRKIDAPKTEISERIKACRPVKVGEPV